MKRASTSLLIVLSGNADTLRTRMQEYVNVTGMEVLATDEKVIVQGKKILRDLRLRSYDAVCFGCKSLGLQRYQFILKTYLLAAKGRQRLIVDEAGNLVRFSLRRYLAVDVPMFLFELLASGVVLLSSYLCLRLLRYQAFRNFPK